MSDTVGFYGRVRMGGEVWRLDAEGAPLREPIKDALRMGEKVVCPSLFGHEIAEVTECRDGEARAESKGLIYPLRFAEDDRGCWTCEVSLSKRAVVGLLF